MVTSSLKLSHHSRLLFSFLTTAAALRPLPHHFLFPSKSFRSNTCRSVANQRTLTRFRMNTYEKHRGEGVLLLTRNPKKDFYPERPSGAEGPLLRPMRESVLSDNREPKDLSSFPMRESVLPAPSFSGRSIATKGSLFKSQEGAGFSSRRGPRSPRCWECLSSSP
jgi:hypothetical protein